MNPKASNQLNCSSGVKSEVVLFWSFTQGSVSDLPLEYGNHGSEDGNHGNHAYIKQSLKPSAASTEYVCVHIECCQRPVLLLEGI